MAAAAAAAARLVGQVVTLLGPEVLVALALGPGARAPAGLEVGEHALLELIKALAVHVVAVGAGVVVADDAHRLAQVVHHGAVLAVVVGGEHPQALGGRAAASGAVHGAVLLVAVLVAGCGGQRPGRRGGGRVQLQGLLQRHGRAGGRPEGAGRVTVASPWPSGIKF